MQYEAKEDLENGKFTAIPKGFPIPLGWSDWYSQAQDSLDYTVKSYVTESGNPRTRTYSKTLPTGYTTHDNFIYNNFGVLIQMVTSAYTIEVYVPSSHPDFEKLLEIVVSAGEGIDAGFERYTSDLWYGHVWPFICKLATRRGIAKQKEDDKKKEDERMKSPITISTGAR